jgi:hypothetical protein
VLYFFAMRVWLTTRQSYLCRAVTHGIDRMHGSPSFSGSGRIDLVRRHTSWYTIAYTVPRYLSP